MAIDLKNKTVKDLRESRAKLVSDAQAHVAANEMNWNAEAETKFKAMKADIDAYSEAITRRESLGGGKPSSFDDPMEGTHGRRGKAGTLLTDANGIQHRVFGSEEKYSDAYSGAVPNFLGHFICGRVAGLNRVPGEMRDMVAAVDMQSGASVLRPEQYAGTIDKARAKSVVMAAGATTIEMKSDEVRFGRRENIVTPEVKKELATFTAQRMTFGHVLLRSFTIGNLYEMSREWVEGTVNSAQLVDDAISLDLAIGIDKFALQGTGDNQPVGLINMPNVSASTAGTFSWSDISGAATEIRVSNHEPNAVILHPTIHDRAFNSVDNNGQWLAPPPTINKLKYLHTTNLDTTNGVIGDFSKFVWGVRSELTIEATTTGGDSFEKHSVLVKVVWRGDFTVADPTAFRKFTDMAV
ncbi:MAG: phage major capsid protein [Aureliella sp.]